MTERIRRSKDRIPDEVLKEIFPKRLKWGGVPEQLYTDLKKMILSRKLKKGQRLIQEEVSQRFNLNKVAVFVAFSRLRKDKLIISKRGVGSFVV